MDNPLVSVIIPTFNRPQQLSEAIDSLLKQTYPHFEAIIVNDAGISVGELVASFDDSRLIYFEHKHNNGPSAGRNTAIGIAKGKYIAYLDDDDLYYPEHLETLIKALTEGQHKIAYADFNLITKQEENGSYTVIDKEKKSYSVDADSLLVHSHLPPTPVIHEKACLDEVGFFDETLNRHEDWDLWIRIALKYPFLHIPKITSEYTKIIGSTQTISAWPGHFLNSIQIIHERYKNYVKNREDLQKKQSVIRDSLRYNSLVYLENTPQEEIASSNIEQALRQISISCMPLTRDDIRGARALSGYLAQHIPENPNIKIIYARLCRALGDYREAILALEQALKYKENDEIWNELILAFEQGGAIEVANQVRSHVKESRLQNKDPRVK
jgi:glycosyltransferase involved in cell wall biosynthesis